MKTRFIITCAGALLFLLFSCSDQEVSFAIRPFVCGLIIFLGFMVLALLLSYLSFVLTNYVNKKNNVKGYHKH
jgi:hypothetical protein